ncbi:MAG: hypothetical protein OXC37_01935, partial [Bdellovibrionaceae bacterium]|nr:hypothetical protein [Pseudobdellovibrionaceae bacterium]
EKIYLDSMEACPTSTNDSNVISKKDADVLIDFLTNLSDLFSSAEESALIIYSEFFSKKSINKLDIQNSNEVLKDFTIFLSDYFIDIFPNYAQFLKNQIDSDEAFLRKNMNPLLKILDQPFSEQTDITLSNVKNMTLSIYIVQHFFKNYDFNKDFYLSSHELKPFFCLVTPLVSIIILPQLKEEWQIIQSIYSPTEISNYIIYNQEFPSNNPVSRNFWNYLIYEADELVLLSYPEISKLISLLFLEFLYRIQVDED